MAVFSVYGGEKCKVDIDFILAHQGSLASYMPDNTDISTEELELKQITREKSSYLDEYGFGSCDAFDVAIIDFVRKGYADEDSLKLLIEGLEKKIKHDADIALLQKAWDLFHASFSNNDSKVLAAFELTISRALQHFNINDLDSVTSIYYELGQETFINSVADKYFTEVFPTLGIREKYDIFHWPRNEYLSLKLDQYFESLAIKGSLSELICAVMEGSGFPDGDLRRGIAQATDDEFYNYFAQLNSKEFTRHARALLKCGEVQSHDGDATNDYQVIFMKSYSALLKLSELTPINAIRMNKFRVYSDTYTKHTNTFKNEQQ
ncbi:hypothetical protein [Pseudomonas sp. DR 5-09]|uniref:hypothetical protein n=1 Tax=Pseudomonas sp. DR 5-09 TaxID=1534110 RepID=UPI0012E9257C|nr:hypothetical protein [Pseudomonas sp. DR 5-09]